MLEAVFDKPSAAVTEEEISAIRYLKISDNYDDGSIDIFFSDRDYYDYNGSDEYFDDYVNYTYVEDTYLEAEDLARFKGLTRLVLDGAYLEDISSYKAMQNLRGLFLYNTVYGYSLALIHIFIIMIPMKPGSTGMETISKKSWWQPVHR